MLRKWLNRLKKPCSDDYKIESIEKVELSENDILVFSVKGQLTDIEFARFKKDIKCCTKHKNILILESDMKVGIIKKQPPVPKPSEMPVCQEAHL